MFVCHLLSFFAPSPTRNIYVSCVIWTRKNDFLNMNKINNEKKTTHKTKKLDKDKNFTKSARKVD